MDHISQGIIVKSTHWMVLHRPVELAAVTGEVGANRPLGALSRGSPRWTVLPQSVVKRVEMGNGNPTLDHA